MIKFCLTVFLFALATLPAIAQTDSTEYEYGLPVTDDDTAINFPSTDFFPPENLKALIPPQLPRRVLRALTKEFQYRGWEQGKLFLDKNTGNYIIEVPRGDETHIFGLTPSGKPVSFNVYTRGGRQQGH